MKKISETRITLRQRQFLVVRGDGRQTAEQEKSIVCPNCQTAVADVIPVTEISAEHAELPDTENFSAHQCQLQGE